VESIRERVEGNKFQKAAESQKGSLGDWSHWKILVSEVAWSNCIVKEPFWVLSFVNNSRRKTSYNNNTEKEDKGSN
jgi:hypothetical protein